MARLIRKYFSFTLAFTVFIAFFGAGHMATLYTAVTLSHNSHAISASLNNCQSLCPLQSKEDKQIVQAKDDDEEQPFSSSIVIYNLYPYANDLYALMLFVLAVAYLKRRPPDLLVANCVLRI